ncbi:MAG: topology modulation protein [Clostridium sp.]
MEHKKIIVLGCSGSGKSTLSKKLGEILNIRVIHLDKLYWNENWVPVSLEEFDKRLDFEMSKESWIIDGNFGRTIPKRLERCDTVIYLDYKRRVCIRGDLKRFITNYGKTRSDMGKGCIEKIDIEFLSWIWNFNKNYRIEYLKMIKESKGKDIYIVSSRKEGEELLNKFKRG